MWRKKNRKTIGIFHIVGCYPNKILLMHTKACPFRKLSCNLFFASFHYERVGFFSCTEKLDFTIRSNMHTNCGKFMFRHHFHCRCKSEPWAFTMFGIQCIRKMDERIDSHGTSQYFSDIVGNYRIKWILLFAFQLLLNIQHIIVVWIRWKRSWFGIRSTVCMIGE